MSIPLQLTLPHNLYQDIWAQAAAERPHECCGLLAGTLEPDAHGIPTAIVRARYPLRNAAASPVRYEGDPADLCRAHRDLRGRGLLLLAIYHSHPTSPPVPSRTDLELNFYGDEVLHLIVSLQGGPPEARCWRLGPDAAREVPWALALDTLPEEPPPRRP